MSSPLCWRYCSWQSGAQAAGNVWNDSFNKAKKTLEWQVYYDHRITLYCGAAFDEKKDVALPEGFTAPKHEKRAGKIEWGACGPG